MADVDLRCGRWQDVLADVECDALITDPPYGETTHNGHRKGCFDAHGTCERREITYAAWSAEDARSFVKSWSERCRGWMVIFTSHDLVPAYISELNACGRYVFAPLPWVHIGGRIRLTGDGPSSWTCWLVVARPSTREFQRWGTLPGAYVYDGRMESLAVAGGKPVEVMRAIVRDYSRPGDLVCDPCAGGATTLIAAALEGRRAVGAEMDPATYEKARIRIERGNAGLRSPNQTMLFPAEKEPA